MHMRSPTQQILMVNQMRTQLRLMSLCLATAAFILASGARADNALGAAIQAYNQRKYNEAIGQLRGIIASQPGNATAHYYMALSYQGLNQMTMAMKEYEWIANYGNDPTLRGYARQAIRSLGKRSSSPGTAAPPSQSAVSAAFPGAGTPSAPKKNLGRCKVILFETDWCHYCKEFAPRFDAAKAQYGSKMDFQKLDADDPSNAGLKSRYKINSFPRLVYLDGAGNVLYNEGRGAFDKRLQELTGN